MPRRRRIELPGELHHVMARGLDGMDIFGSDTDRAHFLRSLDKYLTAFHNRCYAWALMPNHYHLLLRLSASNLGLMMRRLNGSYARYFNKNHSRRGYLFMDRYKSIATQQQLYLQHLIRYIHLNPVRAGLVRDLRSLVSYEWSSHRDYVSRPRHPWCNVSEGLRKFSLKRSEQRRRYMEFLAAGIDGDMTHAGAFEPLREVHDERVVGDPEFVRAALQRDKSARARRAALRARGVDINHIAQRVCSSFSIDVEDLKRQGRGNIRSGARAVFAYLCRREIGLPLAEVASYMGVTETGAYLAAQRGERSQLAKKFNIKI